MPKNMQKEMKRSAELSRLCLSDIKGDQLLSDMEKIVEFVSLDTADADSYISPCHVPMRMREDKADRFCGDRAMLLPHADEDGYIAVLPIFCEEDT